MSRYHISSDDETIMDSVYESDHDVAKSEMKLLHIGHRLNRFEDKTGKVKVLNKNGNLYDRGKKVDTPSSFVFYDLGSNKYYHVNRDFGGVTLVNDFERMTVVDVDRKSFCELNGQKLRVLFNFSNKEPVMRIHRFNGRMSLKLKGNNRKLHRSSELNVNVDSDVVNISPLDGQRLVYSTERETVHEIFIAGERSVLLKGESVTVEVDGEYQIVANSTKKREYPLSLSSNLSGIGELEIEPVSIIAKGEVETSSSTLEVESKLEGTGQLTGLGTVKSRLSAVTLERSIEIDGMGKVAGSVNATGTVNIEGNANLSLGNDGTSIGVKGDADIDDKVELSGEVKVGGRVNVPSVNIESEETELILSGSVGVSGEVGVKGGVTVGGSKLKAQGVVVLEDFKGRISCKPELKIEGSIDLPETIELRVNEKLLTYGNIGFASLKSGDVVSSNADQLVLIKMG